MGKTTLLDDAADSAVELWVARISGIEAEVDFGVDLGHLALAILELGRGDHRGALASASKVFEHDPPVQGTRILQELVEAAIRTGERDQAEAAFERLAERAAASGTPWALGVLARATALMAADEEAEALYREAIVQLGRTYVRTDLARAYLLYGEWLRRQDRRVDARGELSSAHDMFSAMGAQVAGLAATGATNGEIAGKLYLRPKPSTTTCGRCTGSSG